MKKQYFLPLLTLSLSLLVFLNINLDFANAQCMPPYGCGSEGYTPPGGDIETTNVDIVFDTSGNYLGDTVPAGSEVLSTAPGTLTTPGYDPDTGQDQIYGSTIIIVGGSGHTETSPKPKQRDKDKWKCYSSTWQCIGGSSTGYKSRSACEEACRPENMGYNCITGGGCNAGNKYCKSVLGGSYSSLSECEANCGTPPTGETPPTDGTRPPSGDSCGSSCDCCPGDYHYEQEEYTDKNGKVRIRVIKVCDSDRRCKQYTCHWKECSGCCCVSRSRTYTVDCGDSCPCPSSTCSSNCDCCQKGSCYPRVFLNIDPPKLFVNQSFNLSYEAEGDSCCGGLRCTVTSTYQGFNCGQSGMIGICPSDAQGVNVCDPKNQLRSLTSSSGRATITTHSQYWGNCLYKVTCTNSCGNSSSATQTVMTVPVPLWGEESPISNLFSPLKPFISLFSL